MHHAADICHACVCRRNKEVKDRANEAEEEREMLKNMNDEERRQWERENPKEVGPHAAMLCLP